jgi:NAD(P)H-flavin reductase
VPPPPADQAVATAAPVDPMLPRPFRVVGNRRDTRDTVTLALEPVTGKPLPFVPGQFTMLSAFGVGEVPISISSGTLPGPLQHTVRDVGGVTHALVRATEGSVLGVRGPYGTGWDVAAGRGGDVVLVAGGIGLAPLRPAVLEVLADRDAYRRVVVLYGTRTPDDVLFGVELEQWRKQGLEVEVIVDYGPPSWHGRVGLVTKLVPRAGFDPTRTLALVCGPEVMMQYAAEALTDRGLARERIRLSLERAMDCGVGLCGHCQLREYFICSDGPVFGYERIGPLLDLREV